MMHMTGTIKKWETMFDQKAEHFIFKHPVLSFTGMFVGVPLFILGAVGISTAMIILPVSWVLGWL